MIVFFKINILCQFKVIPFFYWFAFFSKYFFVTENPFIPSLPRGLFFSCCGLTFYQNFFTSIETYGNVPCFILDICYLWLLCFSLFSLTRRPISIQWSFQVINFLTYWFFSCMYVSYLSLSFYCLLFLLLLIFTLIFIFSSLLFLEFNLVSFLISWDEYLNNWYSGFLLS